VTQRPFPSFRLACAAVALALAVAGCRGEDPDQAPPIGQGTAAGPVRAAAAAEPSDVPSPPDATPDAAAALAVTRAHAAAALPLRERARRYREAAAAARAELDTAWNGCGALAGEAASRCRDEAVLDYDAAIGEARVLWGDDAGMAPVDGLPPGVLDRTTDLALLQVTGTRG
jgi:hypothetical protein